MRDTATSLCVTVPTSSEDGWPRTVACEIAPACPRCGNPRGQPSPGIFLDGDTDHYYCADVWINPCGHVDLYADVLTEMALQCAGFHCTRPASAADYPHCSPGCAAADPMTAVGVTAEAVGILLGEDGVVMAELSPRARQRVELLSAHQWAFDNRASCTCGAAISYAALGSADRAMAEHQVLTALAEQPELTRWA